MSCVHFFFCLSGKAAVSQTCANHTPKMAVHSFQCSCLSSTYAGPSCPVSRKGLYFCITLCGNRDFWTYGIFCCSTSAGHWGKSTRHHIASSISSFYNRFVAQTLCSIAGVQIRHSANLLICDFVNFLFKFLFLKCLLTTESHVYLIHF